MNQIQQLKQQIQQNQRQMDDLQKVILRGIEEGRWAVYLTAPPLENSRFVALHKECQKLKKQLRALWYS